VRGCTMLTISVDLMVRSNFVAIIANYYCVKSPNKNMKPSFGAENG
jgi:hypothetical protein